MPLARPGRSLLQAAHLVAGRARLLRLHGCSSVLRYHCFRSESKAAENSPVTPMLKHLTMKIKSTGPITVAEYMREVLTNPVKGYYMHRDMLGEKGDFVTSPEISQIFGELIGIWFISEWMATGKPKKIQLVELGPGRGSLTSDILRKTEKGWREVLVDIDPETPDKLRFVLAPSSTPATEAFIHREESRNHVEVCPDAGVIIQKLAHNIEKNGGAALIVDYGHDGTKTDTFRGFRGHKLHDVLLSPGTADLTADVDFSYLRRMAQERVATLGPVAQQDFLKNMGIDIRLQVLLQNASDPSVRSQLLRSYEMLMDLDKMGGRFNFFAIVPHHRLAASEQMLLAVKMLMADLKEEECKQTTERKKKSRSNMTEQTG
uniref:Protein arginine methyltransferase NDUFAF7 n=1 Tax=Varanus komodoensis TaxID=61221 RepID=A0A8D2JKG3_VARKO